MTDKNNSSAPIPACKACDGEGVIHTGIEEAPTTLCRTCDGSGNARATQPPAERAQKPFPAPGDWFPVGVLGHPMREYAPGKWECAVWPSEAASPAPSSVQDGQGGLTDDFRRSLYTLVTMFAAGETEKAGDYWFSEIERAILARQTAPTVDSVEQAELERLARIGRLVISFANKGGWDASSGEGAFEFVQRHSYEVGYGDGKEFNAERAAAPEGYVLVPKVPTAEQWGNLARDIMMAFDMNYKTPRKLRECLRSFGHEIPEWMAAEGEMAADDHTISKGTRAVLIYRAMLAAAPVAQECTDTGSCLYAWLAKVSKCGLPDVEAAAKLLKDYYEGAEPVAQEDELVVLGSVPLPVPSYAPFGKPVTATIVGAQEDKVPTFDQSEFDQLVEKGTKAWAGVPDNFVEELRGGQEGKALDVRREARNKVCIDGYLNNTLDDIMRSNSPDGIFNMLGTLAEKAIDITLELSAQQTTAPATKPCTMRMSQGADVVEVTGSGDGQQTSSQVDTPEGGA